MAKLIYIGGFGRSGSTLLEYLLTSDRNVVACGEIARHLRRFRTRRKCTCGQPAASCPVWEPFQLGRRGAGSFDHQRLTLALLEQVASSCSVMVDSSKTAWGSSFMPFRLHRSLGSDFLLVHVVRDPRAVCWSTIRGKSKSKASQNATGRCLSTVLGWTAANLSCELFGWLHPAQYLRVRYEDLVHAPLEVLGRIQRAIGLPASTSLDVASNDNRHQLYGNRMRFKPLTVTDVQEDTAWKDSMPRAYRLMAAALCWPLAARYGYFAGQT